MAGTLYIAYDGSGYFKIGITTDWKKRLKQFRTGNPTIQFLFLFPVENPAVAELELHTKLESRRIRSEWFSLSLDDLQWIADKFAPGQCDEIPRVWDAVCNQRVATEKWFIEHMDKKGF